MYVNTTTAVSICLGHLSAWSASRRIVRRNGMLSRNELARFGSGMLTDVFIDRPDSSPGQTGPMGKTRTVVIHQGNVVSVVSWCVMDSKLD